jgi:transglutaminase-like putative cysteine protease
VLALTFAVLLCCIAFALRGTTASDGFQPISPEELKMTSEPLAPGAPAIILFRQVDRKDLGRANTEYNYVRIKVLTEEGRKYANIEIPYLRQQTTISNIRARTIHPDGTILNFDGKAYDQVISKSKSMKFVAKTFTVPDVQVGSIVEYSFNYDMGDGYVYDSRWILSGELFTKKAVFSLKPYERFAVQWVWPAGLPAGATPPKQDVDRIVRMTATNIPAFQVEDYMPPENELKFRVEFVYSQDAFEQSEEKYWKSFGKKQYDRAESFINKRKAVEQALPSIIASADAPETKLRKIYERCQQIRNLSYEARRTGDEEKRDKLKAIENADELWNNGYGSGYDITWLFLAMARAAGIEVSPALVASRAEYFFNPKRMNSKELAANVVIAKVNSKELYFDPGAAYTPYGLLPWAEAGVQGRRLDKDGGSWIETPLPESSASRVDRKADFKLTDDGSLEGKVTVSYIGLEAQTLRVQERNEDDTARKKHLEDVLKEYVPASVEVELKNKPDWKSANDPLVAEYEVKIGGWASSAGKRALLPVGLFGAPEKHIFEHANRTFPIYFRFPFQRVDEVNIQLPTGWQVGSVPKAVDRDAKAVQYALKIDGSGSSLHFRRLLRSDLFMVSADKYSVLRAFYQLVRTSDDQQIVLQQGAVAAAN